MELLEFAKGIRIRGDEVHFAAPALDAYFRDIFPGVLRADLPRYVFAAVSHAALMCLRRELLEKGFALGVAGSDEVPLRAAMAGTHPDLRFMLWPGNISGEASGRVMRCLLFEQPMTGSGITGPGVISAAVPMPPPRDPHGTTCVGLLGPQVKIPDEPPWQGASYFDFGTFTLLVRP
ncbi:MAG TPA: hypothetical protein VIL69_04670 [Roseomonas sp.]